MRKYRCRRCGEAFNERQRTDCQAPALYGRKPFVEMVPKGIGREPSLDELFDRAHLSERLEAIRKMPKGER